MLNVLHTQREINMRSLREIVSLEAEVKTPLFVVATSLLPEMAFPSSIMLEQRKTLFLPDEVRSSRQ